MISFVSSAPPIFEISIDEGFAIEPTIKDYIRTGEDHEFEIHVFNKTNGVPITEGISCYMHLYHEDGDHVFEGEDSTPNHIFDYAFDLSGGNFSNAGMYQAKFQCNNTLLGGGIEIQFGVNNYGEELTEAISFNFNLAMIFLMILFLLSLFGLFKVEHPAGKLACYWVAHVLFIVGSFSVWQFNDGYSIAYSGLAGSFKILFYVSMIALLPMLYLSIAWMFYIHTMNDDIKAMMKRGMDKDEAYTRAKEKRKW